VAEPRRYGFHATLKAPFNLSASCREAQLVSALHSLAGLGHAIPALAPAVRMLNGFAAGETMISRAIVEEVAATFDMLPRKDRNGQSDDDGVRIFNAAGRAELWAAGNGNGNGNGHGNGNGNGHSHDRDRPEYQTFDRREPAENFSLISPALEMDTFDERSPRNEPVTIEELGSAFDRSGFGRGNNGQSL